MVEQVDGYGLLQNPGGWWVVATTAGDVPLYKRLSLQESPLLLIASSQGNRKPDCEGNSLHNNNLLLPSLAFPCTLLT